MEVISAVELLDEEAEERVARRDQLEFRVTFCSFAIECNQEGLSGIDSPNQTPEGRAFACLQMLL